MEDAVASPGLSQIARVVDTFTAPSKTFLDIRRNASWWLPFILIFVFGAVFGVTAFKKVGVPTMADNVIHSMPRVEQMMSDNPESATAIRDRVQHQMRTQFYSSPLIVIVGAFMTAALFLMSANFIFGAEVTYKRALAVFWYAMLPLIVFDVLVAVLLAAGVNVDTFLISNPAATNPGYFLQGSGSSPVVVAFASLFDVFSIWIFLLQSLGIAKIGRISFGKACVAVGIWWVLYSLLKLLPVMMFS